MKERQIRTAWQNRMPAGIRARRVLFGGAAFVVVGLILCIVLSITLSRQTITEIILSADSSSVYTLGELTEAAEIRVGGGFWERSEKQIGDAVKRVYPAVGEVRMKRMSDGRVSLTVSDIAPVYRAWFGGTEYVLDADLRVLREARPEDDVIRLFLPDGIVAVPGEVPDLGRDSSYDLDFIARLLNSPIGKSVGAINLEKRYRLSALCNGRIRVFFGTAADLDKKLLLCDAVFRSTDYLTVEYAELDVSDIQKTVLHPCDRATVMGDFTDPT